MTHRKLLFAGGMLIIALALILYPLISNWYNERHSSEIHTHYTETVAQTDTSRLQELKEAAHAYNTALVLGSTFNKTALESAAVNYEDQLTLTDNGIMGYVEIPKISVNLPIYHGTDAETLEAGVGHLLGSSLPVGGTGTHTILTAHSGMANRKMFSDLDQLIPGDVFYVKILDSTLAYQVRELYTVLPEDTSHLGIEAGEDLCTLITCTPFAVNTHRLLVQGVRIPYEEAIEAEAAAVDEPVESTWEQQYVKGIAVGICLVVLGGIGSGLRRKVWECGR